MCTVVILRRPGHDWPLILATNRDEMTGRAWLPPARHWPDRAEAIAGQDVLAGGTWLGIHRNGRVAVVTNYREPITDRQPGERSRGLLPLAFLEGSDSPEQFCRELAEEQHHYGAFNLLVGTPESLWYIGNRGAPPQAVTPGVHGLCNGLLDDPWPKVQRAKQRLANALTVDSSPEQLMEVVNDHYQPPDSELPDTGVGMELERLAAPVFIQSPTYGTRASSVVELHRDRDPIMLEQGWLPDGSASGSLQRS